MSRAPIGTVLVLLLWPCLLMAADTALDACVPGSSWQRDCNTCFCMSDGLSVCTYIECSARGLAADGQLVSRPYEDFYKPLPPPEPQQLQQRVASCSQNQSWTEDCNQCACVQENLAVCTMMECSDGQVKDVASRIQQYCQVGDTWSAGCNSCHCLASSQVICTYAYCGHSRHDNQHNNQHDGQHENQHDNQHGRQRRQTGCRPGSERRVDCNICLCMPDGTEACSRRFCQKPSPNRPQGSVIGPYRPQGSVIGPYRAQGSVVSPSRSQGYALGPLTSFGQLSVGRRQGLAGFETGCPQRCPADCGVRRRADGCLQCMCGPNPFYGGQKPSPVPTRSSALRPFNGFRPSGLTDTDGWTYVG